MRTKQILSTIILGIILCTLMACQSSCSGPTQQARHQRGRKVTVHGQFLAPEGGKGVYAYRDDTAADANVWFYYYFAASTTADSTGRATYTVPSSLPNGGTWAKGAEPEKAEVLEEQTETIAENAQGAPETDSQFEVENQSVEPENNTDISEPASTTEAAPDAAPAPESNSDSSTSDSGGDGGGDGGSSD